MVKQAHHRTGVSHSKDELVKRLNRIEGQITGIKRMVESDKDSADILIQLNSARSALQKISHILLETQADHALIHVSQGKSLEDEMNELRKVIIQYNKIN